MADYIKHLEYKFSIARYELIVMCDSDELRFYLYLKLYAINKHEAFPSYTTIRKDLGWDNKKISRVIHGMVDRGRLKIGKKIVKTKGGKQVANIYDIIWYDKMNNAGKAGKKEKVVSNDTTLFGKGSGKTASKGSGKMEPEPLTNSSLTNKDMSDEPTVFNLEEEIKKLKTDQRRHIQIIGLWIEIKKLKPENKEQFDSIKIRSMRPAALLKGYSDEDIKETLEHTKELQYLTKIGLETIAKFIDGVVTRKKKEKVEDPRELIGYEEIKQLNKDPSMRPIYLDKTRKIIGYRKARGSNSHGINAIIKIPVYENEQGKT